MPEIRKPSDWLRAELIGFGYPAIVTEIAAATADVDGVEIRRGLEAFFAFTVTLGRDLTGVRFRGSEDVFGQLREFVRARGWLTEPEERFVSAFYGLLSDSAHDSSSLIECSRVLEVLRYVMTIVIARVGGDARQKQTVWRQTAHRRRLSRGFLSGLRAQKHSGDSFDVNFDVDFMQEHAKAVDELFGMYEGYAGVWHWEVLRGIVLALSSQVADHLCIVDFLSRIGSSDELVKANLAQSDRYYGNPDNAFDRFLGRLKNRRIPAGACVWEAFYVSRRAAPADKREVIDVLRKRLSKIEADDLATFWRSTIAQADSL